MQGVGFLFRKLLLFMTGSACMHDLLNFSFNTIEMNKLLKKGKVGKYFSERMRNINFFSVGVV